MAHLLDDLAWRGLIAQSTDLEALRAALDAGPLTLYCGFDPTAPSLHVGHLVQILTLRRFQDAGHRPIALVGGATGLIGDPSGRTTERALNDPELVAGWADKITRQLRPFLDFTGERAALAALTVNNLEWIGPLSAIEFLRDIGKHFRVNRMLAKEVVAARLQSEVGISYTEFSYQILQSFDFLELYRRYGCTLQIGGSDQWGNLTSGLDLIHKVEGATAHALATPLVTKADGTKFGKTAGGAVWLDGALTSPYAFFQFWINADDRDVPRYLRYFSLRPREEIEALEKAGAERPAARLMQRALAEELTALVHGVDEARKVREASAALFGGGDLRSIDPETLGAALREAGLVRLDFATPPSVVDVLVATGLVESRSAARRVIAEGGAYLNNEKVSDIEAAVEPDRLLHGRWLVVRRGRRSVAGVERTP
ncbi:MAG: tyrosine--tRNA ligase [Acidothermus sp.]|nr:tyrosine--tRNA ligase [Acidothermus sp.]